MSNDMISLNYDVFCHIINISFEISASSQKWLGTSQAPCIYIPKRSELKKTCIILKYVYVGVLFEYY